MLLLLRPYYLFLQKGEFKLISAIKACQNNYNTDGKYENLSAYA